MTQEGIYGDEDEEPEIRLELPLERYLEQGVTEKDKEGTEKLKQIRLPRFIVNVSKILAQRYNMSNRKVMALTLKVGAMTLDKKVKEYHLKQRKAILRESLLIFPNRSIYAQLIDKYLDNNTGLDGIHRGSSPIYVPIFHWVGGLLSKIQDNAGIKSTDVILLSIYEGLNKCDQLELQRQHEIDDMIHTCWEVIELEYMYLENVFPQLGEYLALSINDMKGNDWDKKRTLERVESYLDTMKHKYTEEYRDYGEQWEADIRKVLD